MTPNELKDEYIKFRSNIDNDEVSDGMYCAQNKVDIALLLLVKKQCPDMAASILEKRRLRYASELMAVDRALLDRAKGGDYKAAELLYRRFENWTPKQAEAELKKNPATRTLAELMLEEEGDDEV